MIQTPRQTIALQVLEAAKDAGDQMVVNACRRVITANRLGWRKHGCAADLKLVYEFYEAARV